MLFGNVRARLIIINDINIFAVLYSELVNPIPKIFLILIIIIIPHKIQIIEIAQKITKNIPFTLATPSSSFFAFFLE